MDSWMRIQNKSVGVLTISLFLLLFSGSFVYGGQWTSVTPPSVSSDWSLWAVHTISLVLLAF
jgi:hypothetical protein